MKLWVFSDLHLEESDLYHEFLMTLKKEVTSGDTAVFAGDIFDLFVGSSPFFIKKFSQFFDVLRELSAKGVELHYVFGNHDFHLEQAFQGIPVRIHDESVTFELSTPHGLKKVYIAHGDLVDQGDHGYLAMRALFRSRAFQALINFVPGTWVEGFGHLISRKSDQKAADLPEGWTEHRREKLRNLYRSFASEKNRQGFDCVVLGHCHDLDQQEPFYWNMGYPPVHRQFLVFDSEIGTFLRYKLAGIPR